MNKGKMLEALKRLGEDPQAVQVQVSKFQLWCLLSAVQLACRHPKYTGPSRPIVEQTARAMAEPLLANDPELRLLWEMGWQKRFDEPFADPPRE